MTNMLTTGKSDINYTELYVLLSRAESKMNDSVHVILKPKEMKRHSYVDVPPDIKLFNTRNVSGMYETIISMMARSYNRDYKFSISPEEYIIAALALYLGIINIFRLKNKGKARQT